MHQEASGDGLRLNTVGLVVHVEIMHKLITLINRFGFGLTVTYGHLGM